MLYINFESVYRVAARA